MSKEEGYQYPEGTIVIEYLDKKGEVVIREPCFAFTKWNLTWGLVTEVDEKIGNGMKALFGEKE